ncbi:MAG: hypothetical protein PWP07_2541 [Epulopiscium sp.]|jgi:hypothetical protein|uniref:Uncharacterized protein n=1 Tax=Defluviitalea raffinosedens TaxID=1450156 RepID=A0A7C8LDY1_9FIRM|nr:hypothetical protein [Defluviitalea raffinosedens]MBZ4669601.1 hypothetical protein [Defluviitaleaceae bacterium]MDK2789296.1 hypothetical protein [Candidatus Epulonipiscium sp.]KAE9633480.1 hypothetical protein GND95_09595 [Defluviitalea raffinosedens]MBM7685951.1 hypothetical protein [Defluviitalea raffinosedens]HHW68167.1 hypothetical protein [Candidatus Epulonipiscium sp.]
MIRIEECWTAVDQTGYYGTVYDSMEDASLVEKEDPNFKVTKGYRLVDEYGNPVPNTESIYFDLTEAEEALESVNIEQFF